jgi:hypothetical protein
MAFNKLVWSILMIFLKCRKYAWFGAVRADANLHQVAPTNRLMDEAGDLTAL